MANGNLTRQERRGIESDIRMVLHRPREFFKCPLDVPDMINLWESLFEPQAIHAYRMLRGSYPNHVPASNLADYYSSVRVRVSDKEVFTFRMGAGSYTFHVFCISQKLVNTVITPMAVAQVVGDDKAAALVHWMREIVSFSTKAKAAMHTLDQVLKLSNTAGQLARMIPEIVPFLSPEKQSLCAAQQKASSLPPEWAAYPREPVQEMTMQVTKCSLLPPLVDGGTDKRPLGYNDYDTWAELLPA